MYRRVTVPLDGTVESRHALPWALTIARKANCPIDLVHVAFPAVLGRVYEAAVIDLADIRGLRRAAERDLRSVADEITALGIEASPVGLEGNVADALIDHIRASDTDLIVMTTHERSQFEHLLLGSVAESVMRHIHTPVLLVREDQGVPALDAPRTIKHILIPVDGSPFGAEIIPHAVALATLLKSEITLLAVLQPIMAAIAMATEVEAPNIGLEPIGARDADDAEQVEIESQVLERTADPLRASGLAVHTVVRVDTQPARAIVDHANSQAIDLIAMTTHGRGALKRLVAGSVSQRVLRTSHTPVLMFRPAHR
jgi:nucleotide-binding universal stress UspA family protein